MVNLGSDAPDFDLRISNPGSESNSGDRRSLKDFDGAEILIVVFTCNHCPYAVHVEDTINDITRDYAPRGVQLVAINSNDATTYPSDSFDAMAVRASEKSFVFPYLVDDSQEVARAYGAECTPDVFVYDSERHLAYRGQIDSTRPRSGQISDGSDLRNCLDTMLRGDMPSVEQVPSVGCNIKWRDQK
jgi:peroxiredoxin